MRIAAFAVVFLATQALACGYCLEDKIAATYDHAVVTRALAQGHHVVFCHVEGAPVPRSALENGTSTVAGVDRGSVRVSPDLLTVSFAFDPARSPLVRINAEIDRRLAPHHAVLLPLRVMERPADLQAVKR